jgi:hypothetical protein
MRPVKVVTSAREALAFLFWLTVYNITATILNVIKWIERKHK